jgi:hypothetical protein
MEHLKGRTRRGYRSLNKGLILARRNGFTWDEGLLHFELAETLPSDDPSRGTHLIEARRLFEKVGSRHDLDRLAAFDL